MKNEVNTPIKSLQDKEAISDRYFLVKDKVKGMGKNGKPFMSLLIGDKTGHIDARLWDRVDEISDTFDLGDIVMIKGVVQVFLGRKQIIIHKIEKTTDSNLDKKDFVLENKHLDAHALYSELITIVQSVKSSHIKQLILDCLQEEDIKTKLLKAPAAKTIHHAYQGGLLEHVVSICKIMQMLSTHYPFAESDLLIFGAVFHDLGKIWELDIQNDQIQYSHRGRLLGHMHLSCELIERKAQRILGFPEDLKEILKHIVLSHHGKLEYGSPVRPYFIEAILVAMIDDLDSKVNTIQTFIDDERQTGEKWSRYNEHFERYFYLDNLKDKWS